MGNMMLARTIVYCISVYIFVHEVVPSFYYLKFLTYEKRKGLTISAIRFSPTFLLMIFEPSRSLHKAASQ